MPPWALADLSQLPALGREIARYPLAQDIHKKLIGLERSIEEMDKAVDRMKEGLKKVEEGLGSMKKSLEEGQGSMKEEGQGTLEARLDVVQNDLRDVKFELEIMKYRTKYAYFEPKKRDKVSGKFIKICADECQIIYSFERHNRQEASISHIGSEKGPEKGM